MKKRILSIALVFVLILAFAPMSLAAGETIEIAGVHDGTPYTMTFTNVVSQSDDFEENDVFFIDKQQFENYITAYDNDKWEYLFNEWTFMGTLRVASSTTATFTAEETLYGGKFSAFYVIYDSDNVSIDSIILDLKYSDDNEYEMLNGSSVQFTSPGVYYLIAAHPLGGQGFSCLIFVEDDKAPPTPTGPTDGAHSSLVAELEEALELGFIPDSMIGNWTQPTSRLLAAEMIVMLIETMTDKTIDEIAEEKGFDMTDSFSDTNDKAVTFLKASGISNGVDGARYDPDGKFTRAQMVTMLGRMAENVFDMDLSGYKLGTEIFDDLAGFGYAHQYIGWAFETGVTLGSGGQSTFNPRGDLQNQHTGAFTLRAYKFFND